MTEMNLKGICKCGNEWWAWRLEDGFIILTCKECGLETRFGVPFPMIDMFSHVADSIDAAQNRTSGTE